MSANDRDRLKPSANPATGPDRYEASESSAQPHVLLLGALPEEHTLYPLNDVDWFVFETTAVAMVNFQAAHSFNLTVLSSVLATSGGSSQWTDPTESSSSSGYTRVDTLVEPAEGGGPQRYLFIVSAPPDAVAPYAYRVEAVTERTQPRP